MRYNRKRTIAALAGILVAAIGLSLWFAPGIIAQKRENDSIREQLPDLPDTNGWPEAFGQALREAKAAVTWRKCKVEGLSELAMLFHANAFLQQAETCYAILSAGDPREARWAYYRSDILLKRGDLTSAENLLKKVVSLKPSYLPAQLKLGDILFKLGKPESAQEVYLRCLQMEAENPYALLGQAREEMRQGKDQETLARLLRLVEKNPEFAAAHMLMAQLLERNGEKRKARLARAQGQHLGRYRDPPDPWMDAVATRSYDLYGLTVLADVNVATRQFEKALDILDRAEKISPGSAKVHLIRGFAYSEMGRKKDSIQSYKKALRFGGDTTLIYGQLAQLYRELDEYPQAIAMVRNGLEKDASSPELLSILGEFLIERGEREKAERHLRKALFEDPASLPALLNLARALWEQGRESEAMDYFEEVRRLAPLNFRSRAFLAQYYLGKGEPERAETPLREAMDLEPENAELRQMLQVCLLESGNRKAEERDYAGAVAYYKEALAGNPGAVELYRNLGVAYAEMEDYESAAESLKSYTEERPEDVNAWLMLGDIAWEEGEHARARDYWRKVIIVARRLNNSDRIIEAAEGRLRRMEPE